jgi:uroporphyrinogen decarboxylase
MLQNDRLIRALSGQSTDRRPVWLMRQAGRYLPEYRALREKAGSFWRLCKAPELAAEAAVQPIARYDLDAAILFSDILTIPEAMGLAIDFVDRESPVFQRPLRQATDIESLGQADIARLDYVFAAVKMTKSRLENRIPLIGFAGSPFTLACLYGRGAHFPGFSDLPPTDRQAA